jgi:hypothetical protein
VRGRPEDAYAQVSLLGQKLAAGLAGCLEACLYRASPAGAVECVGVAGASGGLAGGVGEAWHCASMVPCALLGRPSGGLVRGQPADLLVAALGEGGELSVKHVYKGGKLVPGV